MRFRIDYNHGVTLLVSEVLHRPVNAGRNNILEARLALGVAKGDAILDDVHESTIPFRRGTLHCRTAICGAPSGGFVPAQGDEADDVVLLEVLVLEFDQRIKALRHAPRDVAGPEGPGMRQGVDPSPPPRVGGGEEELGGNILENGDVFGGVHRLTIPQ